MQAVKTPTENKPTTKNVTQVPFATEEEFDRCFDKLDEIAGGGRQSAASIASSETTEKLTSPEEFVVPASKIYNPTPSRVFIGHDDFSSFANSESEGDPFLPTSIGEKVSATHDSAFMKHKSEEDKLARPKPKGKKKRRRSMVKRLKRMRTGKQQRVLTVFKNCNVTIFKT